MEKCFDKKFICKTRHQRIGTNQQLRTVTQTVVKYTGNNQQTTKRNT